MLIITCPHCHDSVRIPSAADESSLVRCPRCHAEYRLEEAFATLPPLVEVLSGPGSSDPVIVPSHSVGDDIGYALVAEGDPPLNLRDSGPLQSPPVVGEGLSGGAVRQTMPGGGGPKLDSSRPRRPKKPEASPVAEFAKIIIGGAIGLLLAFGGILWFGKKDVLEVVPKLPTQAYFLVPAELRTPEMKELAAKNSEDVATDADAESTEEEEPTTDEIEFSDFNEVGPAIMQEDLNEMQEGSLDAAFREAQQQSKPPAEKPEPEEEPTLELPDFSIDENNLQQTLPAVEGEVGADLEKMLQEATDEIGPIGDLLEDPDAAAPPEPDLVEPPVTLEPPDEDSPEPDSDSEESDED